MEFQPTLLNAESFSARNSTFRSFKLHWHNDLEIIYCTEGAVGVKINKESYRLMPGDIILIGSCMPHEIFETGVENAGVLISLGSPFCTSEIFKEIAKSNFPSPVLHSDPDVIHQMNRIAREITGSKPARSSLELRGRLYLLLDILIKKLPSETHTSEDHKKRLMITTKIQNVLDLVAKKYSEDITLDDAAAVSGYEKSAFCRMFKNATNVTFHKYLNSYRIRKAMILLEEEHYTISEISAEVGFTQLKNFCRLFKDCTGQTPTEYRRLNL